MKPLEIFKAGVHQATDGNLYRFSESDCRELVESYDPALYEAAIVKGHPKQEDPRFGSIKGLALSPQAVVLAEPEKIDPAFAVEVNSGKFPYISAKLFTPRAKGNPKPGKLYLRHVGFLGAVPPAVKGLKQAQISFSESGDEEITFACAEIKAVKTDSGEFSLEFSEINFQQEEQMDPKELAAKEASLADKEKSLANKELSFSELDKSLGEREKRVAAKEIAIKRQGITDFVEAQIKEARVPSGAKVGLIEFMACLDEEDVLEFSDAGKEVKKPAMEFFKDFLGSLPPMVAFGEFDRVTGKGADGEDPTVIAAKANDYRSAQLKNGRNISVSEAVDHVCKGGR